jgi:hypothetical protein
MVEAKPMNLQEGLAQAVRPFDAGRIQAGIR